MNTIRNILKARVTIVIVFFFLSIIIPVFSLANDTIRIMPVGNSITAGEHYGFPALEERIGYRKALYEMLIKDGYLVDFVGSQLHGNRSKADTNWYDWNCEAYPGWKIPGIAVKLQQALVSYIPDILLVHVGTNGSDWEKKPGQVKNMLDSINSFSIRNNHPITVFLCLIINRFKSEDPLPTTRFNSEVEKMVQARIGDKIRIILVDMENGAGLDYSDNLPDPGANPPYEGGDMIGYRWPGVPIDKYHPNDKGNIKMAGKFYEELVKVLEAPVVTNMPEFYSENIDIEVFPNPANQILRLKSDKDIKADIDILSIKGQILVKKKDVIVKQSNSVYIDISSLKSGFYILSITNDEFNITKKFLKN